MPWCLRRRLARLSGAALLVGLMAIGPAPAASAQAVPDAAAQPAAPAPAPAPTDPLGRDTPRGTVLGFLNAGKDAKSEIAVQYLRTDLKGADAAALSHQLFTVLDARLPAKLAKLSDAPEGSRANPLKINEEVVGTVERAGGSLDIIVERVEQPTGPAVWLFSAWTLKSIPDVYDEVSGGWGNTGVGQLLNSTRLRRARHFEWLAVVLCLPLFYFVTALLNKLLTPLVRRLWQRFFPQSDFVRKVLPAPIRLVVVALSLRWFLASVSLSLFVRQAGATAANLILLTGLAWLLIQLNGEVERNVRRRLPSLNAGAGIALLRLVRRFADIVVVFLALLLTLRLFAIDPTPALAGLGVGGIAIALAAQKTLENVIAGASLIVDQAVRVGDTLKMGDVVGTVDHIGLRSTRIRTLDRTVVSVPNSQIANVTLETLSAATSSGSIRSSACATRPNRSSCATSSTASRSWPPGIPRSRRSRCGSGSSAWARFRSTWRWSRTCSRATGITSSRSRSSCCSASPISSAGPARRWPSRPRPCTSRTPAPASRRSPSPVRCRRADAPVRARLAEWRHPEHARSQAHAGCPVLRPADVTAAALAGTSPRRRPRRSTRPRCRSRARRRPRRRCASRSCRYTADRDREAVEKGLKFGGYPGFLTALRTGAARSAPSPPTTRRGRSGGRVRSRRRATAGSCWSPTSRCTSSAAAPPTPSRGPATRSA